MVRNHQTTATIFEDGSGRDLFRNKIMQKHKSQHPVLLLVEINDDYGFVTILLIDGIMDRYDNRKIADKDVILSPKGK